MRPRFPLLLLTLALGAVAGSSEGQPAPGAHQRPEAEAAASAPAAVPAASVEGSGPVAAAIRRLEAQVSSSGGTTAILAVDVGSGRVLAARAEHAVMNPASNAKLATAAATLARLGPARRFLTGLYGAVTAGRVAELVLRSDGDPSLTTADLRQMAAELRDAGVTRVGTLLVDQSAFDDRFVPPAFDEQPAEWAPFRAPVAAVSLGANAVTFTVRAGKARADATVTVDPPGFVDLVGRVRTAARGTPEKIHVDLTPTGDRLRGALGGHLPEESGAVRFARRVDDPRLFAGHALAALLKEAGLTAPAEVRLGGERERRLLVAHRSAPVGDLARALGKDSDNFAAEMWLKALGQEVSGKPGTAAAGAEAIVADLRARGAFEPGVTVRNGSGLFDGNRATAWSITTLLRNAYRDPAIGPEFVAHLAIGGVDGTLRSRFRGFRAEQAIRAKTGTLDAVAALSGYVLAPDGGSPVAFAILVNGVPGKAAAARAPMDDIVTAIAAELWKGRTRTSRRD